MDNNQIVVSVDNGLAGAIVILQGQRILEKMKMPIIESDKGKREYDVQAIINLFEKYAKINALFVIEKAQAMPKLGSMQAFVFGKNYGIIMGVLAALKLRFFIVNSRTWQSEMFRDMNYEDTKQASAIVAQRLFPSENFIVTERSKKVHDGMTDASLMGVYAQRHF